jgi:hypothetical protein
MREIGLLLCTAFSLSCNGTTGFELVQFFAAGSGFSGALKDQPYSFDGPDGVRVTLTQASIHVGALYLTQLVPQPGGGPLSCEPEQTYEGAFVGEVRGEGDIDLLDPSAQEIHVVGNGSTIPAATGEVWLVHDAALNEGNVNQSDSTPVLTLQGSYESRGTQHTFSAGITIDANRIQASNSGLPGEVQLCRKRIVSGIPVSLTLAQGGTLVLQIDAAALFNGVTFTDLPDGSSLAGSESGCAPNVQTEKCFTNGDSNLSSRTIFANLTATAPYRFAWRSSAPP